MTKLSGHRAASATGRNTSLVVLLHGYGANGADLFGLSGPLSRILPDTVFRAPNAPQSCRNNPMGYQWFPIPWLDGSTEAERDQGFAEARSALDAYLDASMAEEGVAPDQTVLVGFSQGTMMSLAVAPERAVPVAGVVGFSGRMVPGANLAAAPSKPPVLLIHGDRDEMIPVAQMREAEAALAAAGFDVASHVSTGMGHGIAEDGLRLAASFLTERLDRSNPQAARNV